MKEEIPFNLGYRMPAEWAEHESTWLSWPKNPDSFPEEIIKEVEKTYLSMLDALHKNETVNLLVDDEKSEMHVKELLESNIIKSDNIIFHRINTADVWFRDYGPVFVKKNNEVAYTHWIFNAWGNKYDDLKADTNIPDKMPLKNMRGFRVPIVLEGGSVEVNGLGVCITSEQCLLNRNRNPQLSKSQIGEYLKDYLGATKIIWLGNGIAGDDTDGHVDDLARFVNENTVVCALEDDKNDPNYPALMANCRLLSSATDQDDKGLSVVPLPMPKAVVYNGQRLPASYTNFYIANKTVLVPTFNDNNDKKALNTLQKLFKGREVVGINCRELVYGFGAIHCVTQQQPK